MELEGSEWHEIAQPEAPAPSHFEDVSCYSSIGCVAVAAVPPKSGSGVYALKRNAWGSEPTSLGKDAALSLTGVSCATATDCVVVGEVSRDGESQAPVALEPLMEADGGEVDPEVFEDAEEEELGEGSEELLRFNAQESAEIDEYLESDPAVLAKLGGVEGFEVRSFPWSEDGPDGPELVGAYFEIALPSAHDWPQFEQWPLISWGSGGDPDSYALSSVELRAHRISLLEGHMTAIQDVAGKFVSGHVVRLVPFETAGGTYQYGPSVHYTNNGQGD